MKSFDSFLSDTKEKQVAMAESTVKKMRAVVDASKNDPVSIVVVKENIAAATKIVLDELRMYHEWIMDQLERR